MSTKSMHADMALHVVDRQLIATNSSLMLKFAVDAITLVYRILTDL